MKLYLIALRLYFIWFAIIHAMAFYVLFNTRYISLGIATEIAGNAFIYFLARPATERYRYFFNNHGYSAFAMYAGWLAANIMSFAMLAFSLSYFFHA